MLRCFFFSFVFFCCCPVLFCLLSLTSFFERGWEQRGEGGSGDHAWEREINQRMRDQQDYRVSLWGTAELQIHRNRWEDGKQQVELMKDRLIRKQEEKRREVELCRLTCRNRVRWRGLGTVKGGWRQRRGEMPHGRMTHILSPREWRRGARQPCWLTGSVSACLSPSSHIHQHWLGSLQWSQGQKASNTQWDSPTRSFCMPNHCTTWKRSLLKHNIPGSQFCFNRHLRSSWQDIWALH